MQRVSLLGRIVKYSVFGEKAGLRRNVFTMEGPGRGNGVPCITLGDWEQDEKILQPVTHILQVPGKQFRPKLIHAFNYWFNLHEDKLSLVRDVVELLHTHTLIIDDIQDNASLRRGSPAAHTVYGIPSTINAANYIILACLEKVWDKVSPEAMRLCTEQLLKLYQGQGKDIYWRDNYTCPTVKEYQDIAKKKTGALFDLQLQLMQLSCENKDDYTKLTDNLGLYYQIYNDYHNLFRPEKKGYCEDLTEGKFSFPVIHAITSHPDDSQVIHILRQRTQNVELKKYCVKLLEDFGSLSYTRQTLEELDAELRAEVAKHGGNPLLDDILDKLLEWRKWTVEKNRLVQ